MLEDVAVDARPVERSFIVNVRTAELAPLPANATGGTRVALKPRELGSATWDDKLTLEVRRRRARCAALRIEPVDVPTLYLAGDSTVTDQARGAERELGTDAAALLRAGHRRRQSRRIRRDAEIVRHRAAPRQTAGDAQAGDWVMIQFGHNDQKIQWPQTYAEAATTYRAWLRTYIAEVRRRGATPLLVTSPERRNFDAQGHIVPSLGDYPGAVRAVAREEGVALIDLNAMSVRFYEALGPELAATRLRRRGPRQDPSQRIRRVRAGAHGRRRPARRGPALTAASRAPRRDAGRFDPSHPDPPRDLNAMKLADHISAHSRCRLSARGCLGRAAPREPVSITVRADTPGAVIDPAIYGQFAEHLGR